MIMRTIDPVVTYFMQVSMCNFTGEAFVIHCIYRVFYHDFGLLFVHTEIVDSVRMYNKALEKKNI